MIQEFHLEVGTRHEHGKNAAGRVRRRNLVPAVVYGGGREPESVEVDPRKIESIIRSERGLNTLIHLRIGDRELRRMVMIRDIQRHPVTERILHADFVRVEMDQKIEVSVPVHLEGTPLGVKNEGGLVEFVRRHVEVMVLPSNIPDALTADISELHVGQHLAAGDLKLPEGATLTTPPTETIVTVVTKAAAEVEEAAPAEAATEEGAAPAEGAEPSKDKEKERDRDKDKG
ncbi:MAG: 50S ribosomal protein L25 [Acidobacteria bacterium]|nr:50S ribosomal protein L25 [Acidobacteriota bacterium]